MVSECIEQLILSLQWKRSTSKVLLLISDDMLEYISWNNLFSASFVSKFVILPFDPNPARAHFRTHIERCGFDHIIVLTKHIKRHVISFLKAISALLSPAQTVYGAAPARFTVDVVTSDSSSVSSYAHIEQSLQLPCTITHFPAYALDLQLQPGKSTAGGGSAAPEGLRAFVMASAAYRCLSPLVFAQLSFEHLDALSVVPESLGEVTADMLPTTTTRKLLKGFAAELCGLLASDLRLNVQGRVYSRGKTASLVAQSVQLLTEKLEEESRSPYESRGGSGEETRDKGTHLADLPPAALVLLDRTLDLDLPCLLSAEGGTGDVVHSPFVQRVLATLPRRQVQYHTNSEEARENATPKFACGYDLGLINAPAVVACDDGSASAAEGPLPSKIAPSIAPAAIDGADGAIAERILLNAAALRHSMLLDPEDLFLRSLCTELRRAVVEQGGEAALPRARKREVAAEVLALTQALLSAPTGGVASRSSSISVLLGQLPLLTLANTAIESLARSSGKHDPAVAEACNARSWKCCLDERRRRERELFDIVDKEGFLAGLGLLKEKIAIAQRAGAAENEVSGWSVVADVEHWLLMLGQLFFRHRRAKPAPRDAPGAGQGPSSGAGAWAEDALDFLDEAASDLKRSTSVGGAAAEEEEEEAGDLDVAQIRSLMAFDDLAETLTEFLVQKCDLDELSELCRPTNSPGGAGLLCPDTHIDEVQAKTGRRGQPRTVDVLAAIKRLRSKCVSGSAAAAAGGGDTGVRQTQVDLEKVAAREVELQESFLHMDSGFKEEIACQKEQLGRSLKSPEELQREELEEEELWVRLGLERRVALLVETFLELRATSYKNGASASTRLGRRALQSECLLELTVRSIAAASGRASSNIESTLAELSFARAGPAVSLTDSLAKVGLGWMFGSNDAAKADTRSGIEPEIVVIFIVGGMSYVELMLVENVLKEITNSKLQFIIGATEMKSPLDMIASIASPRRLI